VSAAATALPEVGAYYRLGANLLRVVDVAPGDDVGLILEDAITEERIWRENLAGLTFVRGRERSDLPLQS
jgi:hypothetical protein